MVLTGSKPVCKQANTNNPEQLKTKRTTMKTNEKKTYICTYNLDRYKFTVELTREQLNEEARNYGMPKPEQSSAKEIINCLGYECQGLTY